MSLDSCENAKQNEHQNDFNHRESLLAGLRKEGGSEGFCWNRNGRHGVERA